MIQKNDQFGPKNQQNELLDQDQRIVSGGEGDRPPNPGPLETRTVRCQGCGENVLITFSRAGLMHSGPLGVCPVCQARVDTNGKRITWH